MHFYFLYSLERFLSLFFFPHCLWLYGKMRPRNDKFGFWWWRNNKQMDLLCYLRKENILNKYKKQKCGRHLKSTNKGWWALRDGHQIRTQWLLQLSAMRESPGFSAGSRTQRTFWVGEIVLSPGRPQCSNLQSRVPEGWYLSWKPLWFCGINEWNERPKGSIEIGLNIWTTDSEKSAKISLRNKLVFWTNVAEMTR